MVRDYTIFVSEDGGPFTRWLSNATYNSGIFTGKKSKTYGFYNMAQDMVGKAIKEKPDAITYIVTSSVKGDLNLYGCIELSRVMVK